MKKILLALASILSVYGARADAQVVQLPSYGTFSYSGAVSVPDQGTAVLGGNSYAASGSNSRGFGPYSTRSTGRNFGTSNASVSVKIIDLQAMDEAILSSATTPNSPAVKSIQTQYGRSLAGAAYQQPDYTPMQDPGRWQRVLAGGHPQTTVHTGLAESDIRYYLQLAKNAENNNRMAAARVYYRMAIEAMTPEMQERYAKVLDDREAAKAEALSAPAATGANNRMRF